MSNLSKNIKDQIPFNPKIFYVLRTFSESEFKNYGEFVSSKYFSSNKKAVLLFNAIKKYYPLFTSLELTNEKLAKKITGSKCNDSTMRNLFSALLGLAEEFIAVEKFRRSKVERQNNMLKGLMEKNLLSLFKSALVKQEVSLKSETKMEPGYFLNKYYHETHKFNYSILNEKVIKTNNVLKQIEKLENAALYITIHYAMKIISDQINSLLYSGEFKITDISGISEKLLNDFGLVTIYKKIKVKSEYSNILLLYIKLLKAFSKPNNNSLYEDYKKTTLNLQNILNEDEFSFHFSRLVSYMILKANQDHSKTEYRRELFSLFETMVNKEYYKNDKTRYILPSLYRNIVLLAIELKENEWLRNFISNTDRTVAPQHSQNMINYSNALFSYELGNCNAALNFTHNISLDNFIYKYDIYNLKLKIYYDTKAYEALLDQIHTYMLYIKNDALLPGKKKANHRNFANYLNRLVLFRLGKQKTDIDYHLYKLTSLTEVANKPWLEDKYREVLKRDIAKAV